MWDAQKTTGNCRYFRRRAQETAAFCRNPFVPFSLSRIIPPSDSFQACDMSITRTSLVALYLAIRLRFGHRCESCDANGPRNFKNINMAAKLLRCGIASEALWRNLPLSAHLLHKTSVPNYLCKNTPNSDHGLSFPSPET